MGERLRSRWQNGMSFEARIGVAASHGSRQIQSFWSNTFALNTHCWGESALFTPRGPSLYARHSKSMM
jgi:hypothetical protein